MSTWAIGDIQGCHATLQRLLERIEYDRRRDRLWLSGDLVNRGPSSTQVLRWARDQGDAALVVLGNHDLHLLARAYGVGHARRHDSLDDLLGSADSAELVDWLRHRPLLHREGDHVLVHAGISPRWSLHEAEERASEAQDWLQGARHAELLASFESGEGRSKKKNPSGIARSSSTIASLCTLRLCDQRGRSQPRFKGHPEAAPADLIPWFDHPKRRHQDAVVVFGHWAALGLVIRPDILAIDSGCVWGGTLTAVCLEDRRVVQEPLADMVSYPTDE